VDPIPSTSQPSIPSPPHQSPPHSTPHSPPHSTPHYSPTRSYKAPLSEGNTSGSAEEKGENPRSGFEEEIQEVSLVRESMKEKLADFVTPTKALGEAQEEEISPTILEAAKTLSKVASQGVSKAKSTDKGKRYRRRAREGKAEMVEEDIQATHKTKEQIRQEEAGLEEAIRLQAQMDEEIAKQIHLDKMVAKRVQEEQEIVRGEPTN
ncbi:hypothetical protein Tco_1465529, partial [Tanacetum coccineum]